MQLSDANIAEYKLTKALYYNHKIECDYYTM